MLFSPQSIQLSILLNAIIEKEGKLAYAEKMKNIDRENEFYGVKSQNLFVETEFLNIFNGTTFKVET